MEDGGEVESADPADAVRGGMMRCHTLVGACLSLAVVCVSAQEQPASQQAPRFEAASVKRNDTGEDGGGTRTFPNRWEAVNVPLQVVILQGYNLRPHQLVGGPDWVTRDRMDVRAVAGRDATFDEMRGMVRTLLTERFKLVAHTEMRNVPAWDLVRADRQKLGPSLRRCVTDCNGRGSIGSGKWVNEGASMSYIATVLAAYVNAPVTDRTGLEGRFAFQVDWMVPEGQDATTPGTSVVALPPPPGANAAALLFAVHDQLGLKLEASRASVEVLVIDSVERPTPD